MAVGNQYHKYYHQWRESGAAFKSNARFLQFQLRRRFRVAVDRRRNSPSSSAVDASSDGHYSSVVKRWFNRLRDFRKNSLSSSSSAALSRIRRVKQQIYSEEESAITRMLQAIAVPVLGNVCHVFMHGLNRVQIYGAEKLLNALSEKSKDKPLVTVSNHVASVDDPLVIASLLPPRVLMDAQNLRWTLCATDRCFKNPATSAFFRSVKVMPVSRGDGIYQKGLDMAISKLNNGGWVHIFPEGSRSRDGGKTVGSAKRGVGRLVVDADIAPMVVPFVHTGMQEIMPIGASVPRFGKIVTVLIGDPLEFDDIRNEGETEIAPRGQLYDAVSSRIGNRLQELKVQVDRLALEQRQKMQKLSLQRINHAARILQHVDWESFGMDNDVFNWHELASTEQDRQDDKEVILSHEETSSVQYGRQRFTDGRGIVSRVHCSMDSLEHMGFAARGILQDQLRRVSGQCQRLNPLTAWKQFLEANYDGAVQLC